MLFMKLWVAYEHSALFSCYRYW